MVEDSNPFLPSSWGQPGALGSVSRGRTCSSSVPVSVPPSLGLTILEVACNMELPHGGKGWQQLRQGYLPPEFTASEWGAKMGGTCCHWEDRLLWEGMAGSGGLLGSGPSHP